MNHDDEEDNGPPKLPGGKFYMTPSGHERLLAEFEKLKTERYSVVEIVSWAASNGDRSENADYLFGKKRLREIDRRLRFLSRRLSHAEVVDASAQTQRDRIFFGATVTYVNERDEEVKVTIVGVDEANLSEGTVSIGSPIALALLGKKVGDEVTVRTPLGPHVVEVLDISYPEAAARYTAF